jgi:hypothetical protein
MQNVPPGTRQRRFSSQEFCVQREINLDGGEITILKALGLSGTALNGKMLIEHSGEMEEAELVDSLQGLMMQGYILSSKAIVQNVDDVLRSSFRVNPSYARDLRDALHPGRRREERPRRRRRG